MKVNKKWENSLTPTNLDSNLPRLRGETPHVETRFCAPMSSANSERIYLASVGPLSPSGRAEICPEHQLALGPLTGLPSEALTDQRRD